MNRVHKAADKADNAIKKARHRLDFIDMIENEHNDIPNTNTGNELPNNTEKEITENV